MRKYFYLLFSVFLLQHHLMTAQVLDPGPPPVPPVEKVKLEYKAYLLDYYLPELEDSSSRSKFNKNVAAIKQDFQKPLLQFNDCIYFNNAMQHCYKEMGERFTGNDLFINDMFPSRFPPSLRFSTDGSKNNVDSLYSLHLFPKVQLENYAQPFYFKKFEVTNGEYMEFVKYVIDSLARRLLSDISDEYLLPQYDYDKFYENDTSVAASHVHFKDFRRLNWETKINWDRSKQSEDEREALEPLYLPAEERFWHRKEIDVRKLNYEYYFDSAGTPLPYPWKWTDESDKNTFKDVINVYPDTLAWVHEFPYSYVEPMTNMYFWHPKYADFPVVGITWRQAKAFLNWKTNEEQKKLDAKGIKLKVVYDLPSEIEWEIAATSEMNDGKVNSYGKNFQLLADHSWLTDLMLDTSQFVNDKIKIIIDSTIQEVVPVKQTIHPDYFYADGYVDGLYTKENKGRGLMNYGDTIIERDGKQFEIKTRYYYWSSPRNNFLDDNWDGKKYFDIVCSPDNYLFTSPANLQKVKKTSEWETGMNGFSYPLENGNKRVVDNSEILKQLDATGISYMGGNVSEWLKEDYSDWRPAFLARLKMLHSIPSADAQLEYQREYYFDRFNSKKGKLVRGGNWFDERYSSMFGKNPEGTNAKCFVDPDQDHCTLGFRYVIHVSKK